ncbi:MAG: type II toxin-antitoxin system PemK/MazF family toxin [Leptolyngbyaceae cyanobacterium]
MGMVVKRFDVFLVNLDPTVGSEIQKTRPCVVISPDEMNRYIATVIIAPMTTKGKQYPTRIVCQFQGKNGQIVLDQIRTVDKNRLVKKLGRISQDEQKMLLDVLAEMFAE